MSKIDFNRQIKLNIISNTNDNHRIAIIVGNALTISHLKRKIQTQFAELYGLEIVVKVVMDSNGFIISNNSNVEEHFRSGDTIYFSEHQHEEKITQNNMNLSSNIGEILSTIRFMTASALEKLDKINLTSTNCLQMVTELMHLGFWESNPIVIQKLFKIYNKIFDERSIQNFLSLASQIKVGLLLRTFSFWMIEKPESFAESKQIIWELMQLLEKFSMNKNFVQLIKTNKLVRTILEISKNQIISNEVRRLAVRIIKNINGGGRVQSKGFTKTKSDYIPSILGNSDINTHDTEQILNLLCSPSQSDKIQALELLHQAKFQPITQATVRFQYYQKLMHIFSIRKFKSRKHITIFNQALTQIINNTTKEKFIEIMQKDILGRTHQYLLQGPIQTHQLVIDFIGKACKVSAGAGMMNIERGMDVIDSPYTEFQKHVLNALSVASGQLNKTSAIRFIPGIRDSIKLSLKTNNEQIAGEVLKILGNLTLDEQCRYQIINLKGIEVFVKFLQTSGKSDIWRICAKSLLNLAISTRQNKAKVLGLMNNILEIFYQGRYDSITVGYIETILKSRNR